MMWPREGSKIDLAREGSIFVWPEEGNPGRVINRYAKEGNIIDVARRG